MTEPKVRYAEGVWWVVQERDATHEQRYACASEKQAQNLAKLLSQPPSEPPARKTEHHATTRSGSWLPSVFRR